MYQELSSETRFTVFDKEITTYSPLHTTAKTMSVFR